jgi:hypothetical protein
MRSFIAALRSLVLPYGTTSGQRIVLDGVNGRIDIYDVNNDLLMRLDPEGMKVFDGDGTLRIWLAIPGSTFTAYSLIEFYTKRLDETRPGIISLYDTGTRNRLILTPGENSDRGAMEWTLLPEDAGLTKEAMLQAVCYTLSHADNLRPTIDLTGASSQAGKEPRTVVNDLWYGSPNSFGSSPTMEGSYGKGTLKLGTSSADLILSTTVGIAGTLVGAGNIPVLAGRRYRVMFCGGHSFLTGGSGFSVGDAAEFFLERDAGSGYAEIPGNPARIRIRANVAIAARWAMPVTVAYYEPATNATVDFRARAVRISGAATVDMQCGTNSGGSPFYLEIADVGDV